MARAATLVLLLVLACTGAQATFLGRRFGPGNLCAAGVAPGAVPASTFKAFPANGVIELSWAAVPCATTYAVEVVRTDVSNVSAAGDWWGRRAAAACRRPPGGQGRGGATALS